MGSNRKIAIKKLKPQKTAITVRSLLRAMTVHGSFLWF
jgi:hypothetical protein